MNKKKIVGVIGGMGPMATCDLFEKIITYTDALNDQEHVHLIIDNNTEIPDRSAHILGGGNDPVPEMKKVIKKLIHDGAEVLAMPCNTAHYYYNALNTYAKTLNPNINFVHMIRETAEYCKGMDYEKVMLLATKGTYYGQIYQAPFREVNIEVLYPSEGDQQIIMEAIYAYKSGRVVNMDAFNLVLEKAVNQGVSAIILGCTELPMIAKSSECEIPLVDPTSILAKALATT